MFSVQYAFLKKKRFRYCAAHAVYEQFPYYVSYLKQFLLMKIKIVETVWRTVQYLMQADGEMFICLTLCRSGLWTCIAPKPSTDSSTPLQNEAESAMSLELCFAVKCGDYERERWVTCAN